MRRTAFLLLGFVFACGHTARADEAVRTLKTPRGAELRYIEVLPPGPVRGSAVLFAGGDGRLELDRMNERGGPRKATNFLVRSRDRFAARGFVVAVPDAPSDRATAGLLDWRTSKAHLSDIAALVAHLRGKWPAPVWLIGTSRGTISAAAAGASVDNIAGIVLTASVTGPGRRHKATVFDAPLERISLPVFVVHHAADACPATPPAGAGRLFGRLYGARLREIRFMKGGLPAKGHPCRGLAAHGFYGVETKTVSEIVRWIGTFEK